MAGIARQVTQEKGFNIDEAIDEEKLVSLVQSVIKPGEVRRRGERWRGGRARRGRGSLPSRLGRCEEEGEVERVEKGGRGARWEGDSWEVRRELGMSGRRVRGR